VWRGAFGVALLLWDGLVFMVFDGGVKACKNLHRARYGGEQKTYLQLRDGAMGAKGLRRRF
jgi:hypothetical protein